MENFSFYFFIAIRKHFFYDLGMEKEIKILIGQYGSKKRVAKILGITVRHLENVQRGQHIGKPLEKLIKYYSSMAV